MSCDETQQSRATDIDKRLKSPAPFTRKEAVAELQRSSRTDKLELTIQALKDDDPRVRCEAATSLYYLKPKDALSPLIESLRDSDMCVRCWSATTLGEIGSEEAVGPLINMLDWAVNDDSKRRAWEHWDDAMEAWLALRKLTGVDFQYDVAKWRKWFQQSQGRQ